jgi:hypothetical protein
MEVLNQAPAVIPALTDPVAVASLTALTNNFVTATVNSLFMILVTEIGDKTFFIAAILAMRHGRLVVYAGAMGTFAGVSGCSLRVYLFVALYSYRRTSRNARPLFCHGLRAPSAYAQGLYSPCKRGMSAAALTFSGEASSHNCCIVAGVVSLFRLPAFERCV